MNEEALAPPVSDKTRFGLTRNTLKYIAIVAMVIDHTAHAFVPQGTWIYYVMRLIGRITAPVMFFAAAEGYHHTRNINRYMARLAIFAAVSYFPFIFFLSGGSLSNLVFYRLNVIYTIFLGVAAIRIRRDMKNPVIKTLLILGLFILSMLGDHGVTGVLIMLVFDYYYGNFKNQAFTYCIVIILSAGVIDIAVNLFYQLFVYHNHALSVGNYTSAAVSLGKLLPIILLRFYHGQAGRGGRFSKWFFYIFYPLHLLALGLIQYVF